MRAYFFNNMYLQGIQAGIQAQHCTAEMFAKYDHSAYVDNPTPEKEILFDWANNHKTTIILNGGNHNNLDDIYEIIESLANYTALPFAVFREEGVNDAITSVGIIVPEKIYNGEYEMVREGEYCDISYQNLSLPERELCRLIKTKRLMS